jgi:hypothetical protein
MQICTAVGFPSLADGGWRTELPVNAGPWLGLRSTGREVFYAPRARDVASKVPETTNNALARS